jgi:hypothetical protein
MVLYPRRQNSSFTCLWQVKSQDSKLYLICLLCNMGQYFMFYAIFVSRLVRSSCSGMVRCSSSCGVMSVEYNVMVNWALICYSLCVNLFIYSHNTTLWILFTSPVYNGFIDVNLLHVSVYKRPSSSKYTLLTHSQTIQMHGDIYCSIIIITNTLDFQRY